MAQNEPIRAEPAAVSSLSEPSRAAGEGGGQPVRLGSFPALAAGEGGGQHKLLPVGGAVGALLRFIAAAGGRRDPNLKF